MSAFRILKIILFLSGFHFYSIQSFSAEECENHFQLNDPSPTGELELVSLDKPSYRASKKLVKNVVERMNSIAQDVFSDFPPLDLAESVYSNPGVLESINNSRKLSHLHALKAELEHNRTPVDGLGVVSRIQDPLEDYLDELRGEEPGQLARTLGLKEESIPEIRGFLEVFEVYQPHLILYLRTSIDLEIRRTRMNLLQQRLNNFSGESVAHLESVGKALGYTAFFALGAFVILPEFSSFPPDSARLKIGSWVGFLTLSFGIWVPTLASGLSKLIEYGGVRPYSWMLKKVQDHQSAKQIRDLNIDSLERMQLLKDQLQVKETSFEDVQSQIEEVSRSITKNKLSEAVLKQRKTHFLVSDFLSTQALRMPFPLSHFGELLAKIRELQKQGRTSDFLSQSDRNKIMALKEYYNFQLLSSTKLIQLLQALNRSYEEIENDLDRGVGIEGISLEDIRGAKHHIRNSVELAQRSVDLLEDQIEVLDSIGVDLTPLFVEDQ